MITLIHGKQLYSDIEMFSKLVSDLTFDDCLFGKTVIDFNYIPNDIHLMFENIVNNKVEVQNGTFLKPNNLVYYDEFYEHTLFSVVVALEDTTLYTHRHNSGIDNFFGIKENHEQFVLDNINNSDNWTVENTINIKKNDFILIRPWLFKSFEQDKCVQLFTLNMLLEG